MGGGEKATHQTWGSLGDVSTPGVIYGLQYTTFPSHKSTIFHRHGWSIDCIRSSQLETKSLNILWQIVESLQLTKALESITGGLNLVVGPGVIYIPSCWGDLGDLEKIYVHSHSTPTPRWHLFAPLCENDKIDTLSDDTSWIIQVHIIPSRWRESNDQCVLCWLYSETTKCKWIP